ncbi:MAG: hypothetical protein HY928_07190 [Elusimicrobia bacterium]|nr:hypothetical protein [Elusimicrobiota bacterium]
MKSSLIFAACLMTLSAVPGRAQEAAFAEGQKSINGLNEVWGYVTGRNAERDRAQAQRDAASGVFKPKSPPVELKNGEGQVWARVEKGAAGGRAAPRVTTSFDHKVVVVARSAKAKGWDEARGACRKLAPAGAWDLPTEEDYMTLTFTEAVDIRVGAEGAGLYPMWLRSKDEARNASAMAGKSVLLGMADGKGTDFMPIDVGPESMAEMRKAQGEADTALNNGGYRSAAEEKRVKAAVDEYNRAHGTQTWFNLDVPHPGTFSDEINAILEKPRKAALQKQQAALKTYVGAFGEGYPAYCVSR